RAWWRDKVGVGRRRECARAQRIAIGGNGRGRDAAGGSGASRGARSEHGASAAWLRSRRSAATGRRTIAIGRLRASGRWHDADRFRRTITRCGFRRTGGKVLAGEEGALSGDDRLRRGG